MAITDSARQWMHALARLRAQVMRMRDNHTATAQDALELADEALQLIDTLRVDCARLEKHCDSLQAQLRAFAGETDAVLDLVPTPLVLTDPGGMILGVNRAAAAVLGRSAPRLKHELLLHFFDDRAAFSELVRGMATAPAPLKQILRLRPRERAPFDVEITLARDPRQGDPRCLWFLSRVTDLQTPPAKQAHPAVEPPRSHVDES